MLRGVSERTVRSPFLDELPCDQIEWAGADAERCGRRRIPPQADSGEDGSGDIDQWTIGTLVRHPSHGLGQILSMHQWAGRTHLDVQFQDGSRRSLVLEFCGLKRVDFDDVG